MIGQVSSATLGSPSGAIAEHAVETVGYHQVLGRQVVYRGREPDRLPGRRSRGDENRLYGHSSVRRDTRAAVSATWLHLIAGSGCSQHADTAPSRGWPAWKKRPSSAQGRNHRHGSPAEHRPAGRRPARATGRRKLASNDDACGFSGDRRSGCRPAESDRRSA